MSIFNQTYADSVTAVFQAVLSDDVETLQSLREDNGRSMRINDNQGMQPLHYAAMHGSEKCIAYLLTLGKLSIYGIRSRIIS